MILGSLKSLFTQLPCPCYQLHVRGFSVLLAKSVKSNDIFSLNTHAHWGMGLTESLTEALTVGPRPCACPPALGLCFLSLSPWIPKIWIFPESPCMFLPQGHFLSVQLCWESSLSGPTDSVAFVFGSLLLGWPWHCHINSTPIFFLWVLFWSTASCAPPWDLSDHHTSILYCTVHHK